MARAGRADAAERGPDERLQGRSADPPRLARSKVPLGDRGYDAGWFCQALADRGTAASAPSKTNRKLTIPPDKTLYRQRHRIENMFGKLKG